MYSKHRGRVSSLNVSIIVGKCCSIMKDQIFRQRSLHEEEIRDRTIENLLALERSGADAVPSATIIRGARQLIATVKQFDCAG